MSRVAAIATIGIIAAIINVAAQSTGTYTGTSNAPPLQSSNPSSSSHATPRHNASHNQCVVLIKIGVIDLLICARINCGDRGTCQSDYTCQCYPTYYGDYCEKCRTNMITFAHLIDDDVMMVVVCLIDGIIAISSGSITDGGLAGIIVGWLLALPVLIGLGCVVKQLNDKGQFDVIHARMHT